MTNKKTAVGILGAGISGLSAAYALQQKGIPVTVYERSASVGGAIQTVQQNGWQVEEGPNTLMVTSDAHWKLLTELELDKEIVEANPLAKKRYIVKDGALEPLPSSILSFLSTPLLSASAKLRLLKEPFVSPSGQDDESVASFIKRRLGRQPLDYGVNPFISGVYAGDPQQLSIKHTFSALWEMEQQQGSLLKGLIAGKSAAPSKRKLISFRNGLQTLPLALADRLERPVQTSARVTSVQREGNRWRVAVTANGTTTVAEHNCLISTLPAYTLSSIFASPLFGKLKNLPYAPVSMLALGFGHEQVGHPLDGFGMLIPEVEHFKTLGVLFSSTLFPDRAPKGQHLLTCFTGGARNPAWSSQPKEQLLSHLLDELHEIIGITGKPRLVHHKHWPRAIPQYEVGYDHFLDQLRHIEEHHQGLYLSGSFSKGVSVPDCISSGFEAARKTEAFLNTTPG